MFIDCPSIAWPRQIGSVEPFALNRTLNTEADGRLQLVLTPPTDFTMPPEGSPVPGRQ